MIVLTGPTTVVQSISSAGGLKTSARLSEVVLIRRGQDNKPVISTVNVESVIDGTDVTQDIPLKPYDIVYVPRTTIANINKWVDLYIRKNIPIALSLYYNVNQ